MLTKGPLHLLLLDQRLLAIISLPTPDSPIIKIEASEGATLSTMAFTCFISSLALIYSTTFSLFSLDILARFINLDTSRPVKTPPLKLPFTS